jgi:hypothetical protein
MGGLRIPVVNLDLEWSVKCQVVGTRFCFQVNEQLAGVLTVSSLSDACRPWCIQRWCIQQFEADFVCNSGFSMDFDDAKCVDNAIWTGCPYAELVLYNYYCYNDDGISSSINFGNYFCEAVRVTEHVSSRAVSVRNMDLAFVAKAYRTHSAVRALQLRWRKRMAAREEFLRIARKHLAIDENLARKISMMM